MPKTATLIVIGIVLLAGCAGGAGTEIRPTSTTESSPAGATTDSTAIRQTPTTATTTAEPTAPEEGSMAAAIVSDTDITTVDEFVADGAALANVHASSVESLGQGTVEVVHSVKVTSPLINDGETVTTQNSTKFDAANESLYRTTLGTDAEAELYSGSGDLTQLYASPEKAAEEDMADGDFVVTAPDDPGAFYDARKSETLALTGVGAMDGVTYEQFFVEPTDRKENPTVIYRADASDIEGKSLSTIFPALMAHEGDHFVGDPTVTKYVSQVEIGYTGVVHMASTDVTIDDDEGNTVTYQFVAKVKGEKNYPPVTAPDWTDEAE